MRKYYFHIINGYAGEGLALPFEVLNHLESHLANFYADVKMTLDMASDQVYQSPKTFKISKDFVVIIGAMALCNLEL